MGDRYDLSWSKDKLDYDPLTGDIKWKVRASSRVRAGDLAGCVKSDGSNSYLYIGHKGRLHCAHRIAWFMTFGDLGDGVIDHINGDTLDNRISNLRIVNPAMNSKNKKLSRRNKSGISGVVVNDKYGYWEVTIGLDQKKIYIGSYYDFFEACCARKSKESEIGYHENHGRSI